VLGWIDVMNGFVVDFFDLLFGIQQVVLLLGLCFCFLSFGLYSLAMEYLVLPYFQILIINPM
jgi:hypothetical protein